MSEVSNQNSCKHCGTALQGIYCHECGLEYSNERYTVKSLMTSVLSNVFNIEQGFFHTTAELFKYPGLVIENYLDRNDVKYYPPVRLALVWVTISVLITLSFGVYDNMLDQAFHGTSEEEEALMNFYHKMKRFMNFLPFLFIPFYALMSKLFFRKKKLYYAEHLIIITFATAMATVIGLVPAIIYIIFPSMLQAAQGVSMLLSTAVFAAFGSRFFKYKWYHAIWRAFLIVLLAWLLIAVTGVVVVFSYQGITGTGPFA